MRKYFLFLFVILSFQCTKENDISGNWYTYSTNDLDINKENLDIFGIYYEEVFLSEKNIFGYSNIQGFMIPFSYKFKNDSLFTAIGKNSKILDFRGKVQFLDNNTYIIVNEFHRKDTFYRITNDVNTLDKYLIEKDSFIDLKNNSRYTQEFLIRNEKIYSSIKK